MNEIKLLVVEDEPDHIAQCQRAIRRYNARPNQRLEATIVENIKDAMSTLDKSFDGALIDLRIDGDEDAGNQVIRVIEEKEMCIPVIILTGTPGWVQTDLSYVEIKMKSAPDASYDDILARFKSIYNTGITKILGGRGEIERILGDVFRRQIAPQINQWEPYGAENPKRAENALLRHIMYHLVQIIDQEAESSFPEEFYLYPSANEFLRTGAVIDRPGFDRRCVVISPDCDLVVRDGRRKTDKVVVAEILPPKALFPNYETDRENGLNRDERNKFKRALENNHTLYFHCMPQTEFSGLGFIDFRRLRTVPENRIDAFYNQSRKIQISPPFVKDIVSRFSTYYARQGQPVIDADGF